MLYPRNAVERYRVWQFFESSEKGKFKQFPPDTTIHVGYKVQRPNRPEIPSTFVSVDSKLNITVDVNLDLFIRFGDLVMKKYDADERGPVLCATHSAYLEGCLPRLLRKYTVCSLDFNGKILDALEATVS